MRVAIDNGYFDSEHHIYTDMHGHFVPSLTQVLKLQGLVSYAGVDPEVMENAARRGTEVHELAACLNRYGEVDPSWVTPETDPYLGAYRLFLEQTGFKPDPQWSEVPMIATIHGYKVGVTPDCHGTMGRDKVVLELKCTSTRQSHWSIQTALQECAIYKSNRCGRVRRFALMLFKDGKYRLGDEHKNHEIDMAVGISALTCVWWRIWDGQDIQKIICLS